MKAGQVMPPFWFSRLALGTNGVVDAFISPLLWWLGLLEESAEEELADDEKLVVLVQFCLLAQWLACSEVAGLSCQP
eukprot:96111-Prorocentrum_lima.AAC.1